MARYRRSNRWIAPAAVTCLVGGTFAGYYWISSPPALDTPPANLTSDTPLTTDRPEAADFHAAMPAGVTEKGNDPGPEAVPSEADKERSSKLVAQGRASAAAGDLIAARAQLNEALDLNLPASEAAAIRAELSALADQTLFSSKVDKNDPLVGSYVVAPGDVLAKVANKFHISSELLCRINEIKDPNVIRAGRRLKVIHGPFHAVVSKRDFRIDVYLQDTFVKSYPVGLGENDSTPTGEWRVTEKLVNPTYYPPRGGPIIAADDPQNPLGERWLALEGVSGEAVGMERYGIHGTIEPESIGKNATLGCVRLYNPDVEFLYDLLVAKESKLLIQ